MTRIVMLIILFALFALGGFYIWREWRIDDCFEGGGRWNYETRACESPRLPAA